MDILIFDIFTFLIVLVIIGISLFWLYFNRDPARQIPKEESIVSPADGNILEVATLKGKVEIDKGLLGKIKTLTKDVAKSVHVIVIFMTPFDVHVQRAPMEGKILSVKYSKGTFFRADSLSALENERNEIIIQDIKLKVKVVQIAGFVARRIKTFVKEGDPVLKGQRIGKITLGSQVVLIIPDFFKLKVKKGDWVKAGESVIALY